MAVGLNISAIGGTVARTQGYAQQQIYRLKAVEDRGSRIGHKSSQAFDQGRKTLPVFWTSDSAVMDESLIGLARLDVCTSTDVGDGP